MLFIFTVIFAYCGVGRLAYCLTMTFHDLEKKRIEKAVEAFLTMRRPPAHIRPQWDDPSKIHKYPYAKATYVKRQGTWKIYWRRQDLKWHGYEPNPTASSIEGFLQVVDADVYHCFFG